MSKTYEMNASLSCWTLSTTELGSDFKNQTYFLSIPLVIAEPNAWLTYPFFQSLCCNLAILFDVEGFIRLQDRDFVVRDFGTKSRLEKDSSA